MTVKIAYKCPVCSAELEPGANNEMFESFRCSICRAELILHVREKINTVTMAGTEVHIDNPEVFNILKQEYK